MGVFRWPLGKPTMAPTSRLKRADAAVETVRGEDVRDCRGGKSSCKIWCNGPPDARSLTQA
jgi:hypothetical protein